MSAVSHAGVRRAFRLVGDQLEAERLARIAARDAQLVELPAWQARQLARTSCQVPGCSRPGRLTGRGRYCAEQHLPPQPTTGYCAPGRCYCPSTSCRRPA